MSGTHAVSQILIDIVRDVQEILRAQIRSGINKFRDEVLSLWSASLLLVAGALCGFLSAFFVLLFLVGILSLHVPVWAASLGIAIALAVVAAIILILGAQRIKRREHPMPRRMSRKKTVAANRDIRRSSRHPS